MTSFFEHILFQAKSHPKAPAIMTARVVVTYEELVNRVRGVMKYLSEQGVKSGQILALNMQDPTAHCSAMIGAMASGVATLSAVGARPSLPKNLAVDAMLSDHPVTVEGGLKILTVAPTWLKDQQFADVGFTPGGMSRDAVARIITTSGTTGEQKAVPFTEEQLVERVYAQVVGLRPLAGPSKTLGMMGVSSGAGFTNMMLILMTGGTLMLVPGLAQLSRVSSLYKMDRILASTAQLIAMLRQQENDSADFSGVKSMVVGGSHIPRSVAKRARVICRNIICLYGATEVGVVATAPTELSCEPPIRGGVCGARRETGSRRRSGNAARRRSRRRHTRQGARRCRPAISTMRKRAARFSATVGSIRAIPDRSRPTACSLSRAACRSASTPAGSRWRRASSRT